MQTFPEPPKSYSLIQNLRPSVSLSAETSQPDFNPAQNNFQLRHQIAQQVENIIHAVQTSNIEDLKTQLKVEIHQLQKINVPQTQTLSGPFGNMSQSEDLILSKLKQLAIISDILVQRMNEKYSESKTLYEDFYKSTVHQKKIFNCKIMAYCKQHKKVSQRIQESQQTEKKPLFYSEEKEEIIEQQNMKRTRKQATNRQKYLNKK